MPRLTPDEAERLMEQQMKKCAPTLSPKEKRLVDDDYEALVINEMLHPAARYQPTRATLERQKTMTRKALANKYGARAVRDCPHCHQSHGSQVEAAYCAFLHTECEGIVHVDVHPVVTLACGRFCPDLCAWTAENVPIFYEVKRESRSGKNPGLNTAFKRAQQCFLAHPAGPLVMVYGSKTAAGWSWRYVPETREKT